MKFAFETITWGRYIEDFEEVLKLVHAFGYQGIELAQRLEHVKVRQADGSTKTLRDLGPDELEKMLARFPLADGSGHLQVIGLAGGPLRDRLDFCLRSPTFRPFLYVEDLDDPVDDLLDAILADNPFVIALHPHWFKKIQRIDHAVSEIKHRLDLLLEDAPDRLQFDSQIERTRFRRLWFQQILLIPDTAHLTIAGDQLPERLPPNDLLAAVHLKDWDSSHGRYSHRYAQGFVALGHGMVKERVLKVLEHLRDSHFEGWLVVEQDVPESGVEESLFDCTDWLLKNWNEAAYLRLPPKSEKNTESETVMNLLIDDEPPSPRDLSFLRHLLPATTWGPRRFYQRAADALYSLGGFVCVQIYGWYPGKEDALQKNELFRLGESGLSGACPILATPLCLCGVITRNSTTHWFDLRGNDQKLFEDRPLLNALEKHYDSMMAGKNQPLSMISVPVFNISTPAHLRYVINLFPKPGFEVDAQEIERLGRHISRLADHVGDEICSAAFLRTSYLVQSIKDQRSYLDALRQLIQHDLLCGGVTILLEDDSRERLLVASSTGVVWREDLPEHRHYYTKGEGQTGEVWATGEIAIISDNLPHYEQELSGALFREHGPRVHCKECMFVPIGRPWSKPIGVVRVVDKIDPNDGCRATTMFTDDDAAVLDSIIQAALPQLELWGLQERQLNALSRMTHEFKAPLLAIQGSVDQIRREWKALGITEQEMMRNDYLEDILDWCQIMGNQVQNARIFSATPNRGIALNLSRVRLKRDVIVPAIKHLRRFMRDQGVTEHEIQIGSFDSVPFVYVDKGQMLQVALNLIANATKYRDPNRAFRMSIDGYKHGSVFVIAFNDWGMGVPLGLEELIFEPGYRARAATLRDVTGQGIGLAVVRSVLASHGGQIRLSRHTGPTTFEIILPDRLAHKDWNKH